MVGMSGSLILSTPCSSHSRRSTRRRGARSMWLGTNERNLRAITFYTRHGFAVSGPEYIEDGILPAD